MAVDAQGMCLLKLNILFHSVLFDVPDVVTIVERANLFFGTKLAPCKPSEQHMGVVQPVGLSIVCRNGRLLHRQDLRSSPHRPPAASSARPPRATRRSEQAYVSYLSSLERRCWISVRYTVSHSLYSVLLPLTLVNAWAQGSEL